ncbi:hypothetical protein DQ04_21751010, partial [Trypanosoma grayi]|uniref:hypothetical protein n=1 Tax=Trypanosoma grayi TaxID=71804 RepID=UPI0004F4699C
MQEGGTVTPATLLEASVRKIERECAALNATVASGSPVCAFCAPIYAKLEQQQRRPAVTQLDPAMRQSCDDWLAMYSVRAQLLDSLLRLAEREYVPQLQAGWAAEDGDATRLLLRRFAAAKHDARAVLREVRQRTLLPLSVARDVYGAVAAGVAGGTH